MSALQQLGTPVMLPLQGKDCQLEGKQFQFLITSYNFVPKLKDQLQTLAPKVIVLDEAHSIKASKASWQIFTVYIYHRRTIGYLSCFPS